MTTETCPCDYSKPLREIMSERNLTDADVAAIVDALKGSHDCRFQVGTEEFITVWGDMKAFSDTMTTAKKTTTKVVITAMLMFIFGGIGLAIKGGIGLAIKDWILN